MTHVTLITNLIDTLIICVYDDGESEQQRTDRRNDKDNEMSVNIKHIYIAEQEVKCSRVKRDKGWYTYFNNMWSIEYNESINAWCLFDGYRFKMIDRYNLLERAATRKALEAIITNIYAKHLQDTIDQTTCWETQIESEQEMTNHTPMTNDDIITNITTLTAESTPIYDAIAKGELLDNEQEHKLSAIRSMKSSAKYQLSHRPTSKPGEYILPTSKAGLPVAMDTTLTMGVTGKLSPLPNRTQSTPTKVTPTPDYTPESNRVAHGSEHRNTKANCPTITRHIGNLLTKPGYSSMVYNIGGNIRHSQSIIGYWLNTTSKITSSDVKPHNKPIVKIASIQKAQRDKLRFRLFLKTLDIAAKTPIDCMVGVYDAISDMLWSHESAFADCLQLVLNTIDCNIAQQNKSIAKQGITATWQGKTRTFTMLKSGKYPKTLRNWVGVKTQQGILELIEDGKLKITNSNGKEQTTPKKIKTSLRTAIKESPEDIEFLQAAYSGLNDTPQKPTGKWANRIAPLPTN
jgi:hypothetical protein